MTAVARRHWRLVAGLGLLALLLVVVDPRAVLRATAGAQPGWLGIGLACAVSANVVSALRWWALARWLGADVGPGWAVARYFGGVALNALLPGAVVGGDVYRAHALVRAGLPWAPAGSSVLVDRLGGLWVLVAVGLMGASVGLAGAAADVPALQALGMPPLGLPIAAAAGLALGVLMMTGPVVLVAALRSPRLRHGSDGHAPDPAAPADALADRLQGLRRAARSVPAFCQRPGAQRQLALQLGLSVAVQAGSIAALACAGVSLGVALDAWAWVSAAAPVFVMAALPVSFGGWGSREAACIAALGLFGVAAPLALGVGLLYGLGALAQALPGALLLAAERRAAGEVRKEGG